MNQEKAMKPMDDGRFVRLLCGQRWACLGSSDNGRPHVSWVAYVVDEDGSLLLHLSRLAKHTRNLLTDSGAELSISEKDDGECDPQTLARVTLSGHVEIIERGCEAYEQGKMHYLARLPDAEMLFSFEDFSLLHFIPHSAHYVEGFGSTHRLMAEKLQQIITSNRAC